MGLFKKFFGAVSNKKYRKNEKATPLTFSEQTALNIGAINAEQVMCYSNSLETGLSKTDLYDNLNNFYEICDSNSAYQVLDTILNRGDALIFESIKNFVAGTSSKIDDSFLEDKEHVNSYSFINNLKETTDDLLKYAYIRTPMDFNNLSILSWDMGRLVLIARCSYELDYISKEDAWKYINEAYDKCHYQYTNWTEFSKGYIVGRAMRFGSNISLYGIMDISKGLLVDTDSPWKKYPL